MPRVAGGDLLRKRIAHQLVSHQCGPQCVAFPHQIAKHFGIYCKPGSRGLNDGLNEAQPAVECAACTDQAVLPNMPARSRFSASGHDRLRFPVPFVPITEFVDTACPHNKNDHIRLRETKRFGKAVLGGGRRPP